MEADLDWTEKALRDSLNGQLDCLHEQGRCVWRKEMRMICFTHAARSKGEVLRIDYVAELDGILVGIEAKKTLARAADLGAALIQCAQYAAGVVAPAGAERDVGMWINRPLLGVFLLSSFSETKRPYVFHHALAASRLFGVANVGFVRRGWRTPESFDLTLCGGRAWSPEWGWNQSLIQKGIRSGNGTFQVRDGDRVPAVYSSEPLVSGFGE